LLGRALVL